MKRIIKIFKKLTPKTLLSRFILIILLPLTLIQCIYIYIFIDNYWDKVNKKTISLLIREIKILNNEFDTKTLKNYEIKYILQDINSITTLNVDFSHTKIPNENNLIKAPNYTQFLIFDPIKQIKHSIALIEQNRKTYFQKEGRIFVIYIEKNSGYFLIEIPMSRIITRSIGFFLLWAIVPAFLIGVIMFLFMKNQIKAIKILTQIMTDFSNLEKENENFKPSGASEIKEMGVTFLKMQKDIKKYINNRILMLAEISHDLRTPLTRMKLETEFIPDEETANNIKNDLIEMEKMINDYLYFAKGEKEEKFEFYNIKDYFDNILYEYRRSNYNNIKIKYFAKISHFYIKHNLFKRAINNVINNALKYAKNIEIFIYNNIEDKLEIIIEDDGTGISEEFYNKITKSFYQIEKDITENNKYYGLGLAIVKKIVFIHNGELYFEQSKKLGGFSVKIII